MRRVIRNETLAWMEQVGCVDLQRTEQELIVDIRLELNRSEKARI